MSQEKMTQDEIDALLNNLKIGEFEDPITKLNESSLNPEQVKYKYNAIVSCKARYEYALKNGTYEDIREAARNLHRAGFSNWLFKYGLDRESFCRLMNREAKKRGLRQPFKENKK
jgi:flagellar motor switch protein FliM